MERVKEIGDTEMRLEMVVMDTSIDQIVVIRDLGERKGAGGVHEIGDDLHPGHEVAPEIEGKEAIKETEDIPEAGEGAEVEVEVEVKVEADTEAETETKTEAEVKTEVEAEAEAEAKARVEVTAEVQVKAEAEAEAEAMGRMRIETKGCHLSEERVEAGVEA